MKVVVVDAVSEVVIQEPGLVTWPECGAPRRWPITVLTRASAGSVRCDTRASSPSTDLPVPFTHLWTGSLALPVHGTNDVRDYLRWILEKLRPCEVDDLITESA